MKPETIQEKFGNSLYHSAIFIPEWHLIKESLVVEKDNTNCFLIALKSGGTGLNLISADIVIHLDVWWNPQIENQATDRAHRIGQTKTVTILKLINEEELSNLLTDGYKKDKEV